MPLPTSIKVIINARSGFSDQDEVSRQLISIFEAPGISTELSCGPMAGREVSVEYVARPDAKLKVEGEITAIQFK